MKPIILREKGYCRVGFEEWDPSNGFGLIGETFAEKSVGIGQYMRFG